MSTEQIRCRVAGRDPGPYVLGALSPADRLEFERHAATCSACRAEIASLAAMPGLLARLDRELATSLVDEPPSPSDQLLNTLLVRVKRQRRQRTWARTGLAAALSAAAVALVFVLVGIGRADRPSTSRPALVAMTQVTNAPITAEIAVAPALGGSTITMHCVYADGDSKDTWVLRLVAYGRDGTSEEVSSWNARAGDDLTLTGLTRFVPAQIAHVDVQRGNGTTMLTYVPA
jgi:anti-sigma-K factor RskA